MPAGRAAPGQAESPVRVASRDIVREGSARRVAGKQCVRSTKTTKPQVSSGLPFGSSCWTRTSDPAVTGEGQLTQCEALRHVESDEGTIEVDHDPACFTVLQVDSSRNVTEMRVECMDHASRLEPAAGSEIGGIVPATSDDALRLIVVPTGLISAEVLVCAALWGNFGTTTSCDRRVTPTIVRARSRW